MTQTPTLTGAPAPAPGAETPSARRRGGRWIEHWTPEDPDFWADGGAKVARRNLWWSILAEHVGFSVWMLWSVSAVYLAQAGFDVAAIRADAQRYGADLARIGREMLALWLEERI